MEMQLIARNGSEYIRAYLETDDSWKRVQGLSKSGRLLMCCCDHPAKATRSPRGLKHFAHKPGSACSVGSQESEAHLRLKIEALTVAHELGFDAIAEYDRGTIRPDVEVVQRGTKKNVAIEIQLSRQTGYTTNERTSARAAQNLDTVWFFGNKRDYFDAPKDQRHVFPVRLPSGDIESQIGVLREKLSAFLRGVILFDDLSNLTNVPFTVVGYDFPCGGCGRDWYRTSYAGLYPNRIRGDLHPVAVPLASLGDPAEALKALAERTGKATGRVAPGGMGLLCPHCGTAPEAEFITPEVALRAPARIISGHRDMRRFSGLKPGWWWRRNPVADEHWSDAEWAAVVEQGVNAIKAERQRIAREKRLAEERRRMEAERAEAIRSATAAELASLTEMLDPHLGAPGTRAWLDRANDILGGRTPRAVVQQHIRTCHSLPPVANSAATELAIRMLDGRERLTEEQCGLPKRNLKQLRKSRRTTAAPMSSSSLKRAWERFCRLVFG